MSLTVVSSPDIVAEVVAPAHVQLSVQHGQRGEPGAFLTAEEFDDSDEDHIYYGGHLYTGVDLIEHWQVNRWTRPDLDVTRATEANNPGVTDLPTAWAGRGGLTYG